MVKKLIILVVVLMQFLYIPQSIAASFTSVENATTKAPDTTANENNIQDALKAFQGLSSKEKKSRFREMKKAMKKFRADKKAGNDISSNTLILILLSIFIPPLAVYLHEGDTNNRFWISVILTVLGYFLFSFAGIILLGSLPGIIYALIIVLGS